MQFAVETTHARYVSLKVEVLCVAAIFAFIAFNGTYKLAESPGVWYDEGYVLQASKNLAIHGREGLQTAPGVFTSAKVMSIGFPILAPIALSFKTFGFGLLQARFVMALYILAFCAAIYALIRGLYNPRIALWSVLLLSSYASLYGNGKSALGEVPGLFFVALTLYLLHRLEKSAYTDTCLYALFGLTAGLCIASKPNFILLYPAIGLVYLLRYRSIPLRLRGVIVAIFAFLAMVALWIHTQFGTDTAFSELFNLYTNPYEISNPVANALGNLKRFFTELTPMYTLALVGIWGMALFVRRKAIATAELVAFIFCIVVLLEYLRLAEWYRYFFQATIIALVFLVPSLLVLYKKSGEFLRIPRRFPWVPYALIALLFALQTYQLFTTSYVAGFFNSHRTRDLQTYVSGLPKDASVYFYNVPEAVFFAPSENYYGYIDAHEHSQVGADTLPLLGKGIPDYVVVNAERFAWRPEVFTHYVQIEAANRYLILRRK